MLKEAFQRFKSIDHYAVLFSGLTLVFTSCAQKDEIIPPPLTAKDKIIFFPERVNIEYPILHQIDNEQLIKEDSEKETKAIPGAWTATPSAAAPSGRCAHTAVWTGTQMLVWGGTTAQAYMKTGGRYALSTNTWAAMNTGGSAPDAREGHMAAYASSRMYIWGGYSDPTPTYYNDGKKYNPTNNNWGNFNSSGTPTARSWMTWVTTSSGEVLIWGGIDSTGASINSGAILNTTTDVWTAITTTNAPTARNDHSAVWTGSTMIIWGGYGTSGYLNTGGIYNRSTGTWTTTSTVNAPSPRAGHTAVWTGSRLIIWGGLRYETNHTWTIINSGGVYDPTTDTWTSTNLTNPPVGRYSHSAVWTGTYMLIWGGSGLSPIGAWTWLNSGAYYNPATDTWSETSTTSAPSGRNDHSSVWADSAMIIFGGVNSRTVVNSGGYFTP